jgi:general secretion pathway protein A
VACFRGTGGLAQLRELGRPAALALRDAQGQPGWLLVTALGERSVTLQAGNVSHTVSPAVLAGVWRGEYATLWRTPPGWRDAPGEAPDAAFAAWMSERLPGKAGVPLKARVTAFQIAQGLKPDGLAGPMTLMQLNRAGAVDEPGLGTTTP